MNLAIVERKRKLLGKVVNHLQESVALLQEYTHLDANGGGALARDDGFVHTPRAWLEAALGGFQTSMGILEGYLIDEAEKKDEV